MRLGLPRPQLALERFQSYRFLGLLLALLRVVVPEGDAKSDTRATRERVETLMGRRPELRFALICEHARFVADTLDV